MRSEIDPESTLVIAAVASATPSMSPTTAVLAPRVPTRKSGSRLNTDSDEISMNRETRPKMTTERGIWRQLDGVGSIMAGLSTQPADYNEGPIVLRRW
jgi:hypothetical protein